MKPRSNVVEWFRYCSARDGRVVKLNHLELLSLRWTVDAGKIKVGWESPT